MAFANTCSFTWYVCCFLCAVLRDSFHGPRCKRQELCFAGPRRYVLSPSMQISILDWARLPQSSIEHSIQFLFIMYISLILISLCTLSFSSCFGPKKASVALSIGKQNLESMCWPMTCSPSSRNRCSLNPAYLSARSIRPQG